MTLSLILDTRDNETVDVRNQLARIRRERGLSAAALAHNTGVSRQTVYAIEAGDYVPNTAVALRLAQTLESTVEALFSIQDAATPQLRTERVELLPAALPVSPGQPVQLCRVDRRLVGWVPSPPDWHLPLADSVLVDSAPPKARVQLFRDPEQDLGHRLMVAGCDPGISVLARHAQRSGVELVLAHGNSSQALELLKQGRIHVAGSHLSDNLPAIRKLFPPNSVAVFSFAVWEEGIVVARGNPKSIRDIAGLTRKGVRLVNREPGSGSRMLLDARLREAGIPPAKISGYKKIALGHLPAAWQVRAGETDCCIATRAAARVFGLDFFPLASESYDLAIRRTHLGLPAVQMLLDALARSAFRRELETLGGYDAAGAGRRIA